jgi:hypothetical protein
VYATLDGLPLGPAEIAAWLPEAPSRASAAAVRGAVEFEADLRRAQRALGWTSCGQVAEAVARREAEEQAKVGGAAAWRQRLASERRTMAGWRATVCLELMWDALASGTGAVVRSTGGPPEHGQRVDATEASAQEVAERLRQKAGRYEPSRQLQLRDLIAAPPQAAVLSDTRRQLVAGEAWPEVRRRLYADHPEIRLFERGWTHVGDLPVPLAVAVSELQAGAWTPLVAAEDGVHLLQVLAWREPLPAETLASARTMAAQRLLAREHGLLRRRQVRRELRAAQPLQWTAAWAPAPLRLPTAATSTTTAAPATSTGDDG